MDSIIFQYGFENLSKWCKIRAVVVDSFPTTVVSKVRGSNQTSAIFLKKMYLLLTVLNKEKEVVNGPLV